MEAYSSALYGVEHLGSVEAEHGSVAEVCGAYAVVSYPESVSRVINDLQSVLCGYPFYALYIAQITINVYRHDSAGPVGDKAFDLADVDGVIVLVDVTEDRLQVVSHDGVSS